MLRDSFVTPIIHAPDIDHVLTQANCTSPLNEAKNDTLYIGDSMLKHLNSKKMSSLSQKALVFAYSGATAGGILSKLKSDPEFLKLDPLKISKIYVLCGANNVDKVLHVPFNKNSDLIDDRLYHISENDLNHAKEELTQLGDFLHSWARSALISYINILPRESSIRNYVINSLNQHIKKLTCEKPFFEIVSTELHRNLFTLTDGFRKGDFFHTMTRVKIIFI